MVGGVIELPFPDAKLAGHNTGHWKALSGVVRKHREWAKFATLSAAIGVHDTGDILLLVTFIPPNRRGDRINFSNRMKPYFDGIAEALGVNDSRFLPAYKYADPQMPGKVIVEIAA
jgi:crossover junction endodeoxyribonuclease RusA